MADESICKIDGCNKRVNARGWCKSHWQRWRRNGSPLGGRTPVGEAERYFREVVLTYEGDDCLLWPYGKSNGYGTLNNEGGSKLVHRRLCEETNGPAPTPDHEAAHSCGRGHLACATKRHLSWKTPKENTADKATHGTRQTGERNPLAKLTEDAVTAIRADYDSQQKIAEKYGVTQTTISCVKRGSTWAG